MPRRKRVSPLRAARRARKLTIEQLHERSSISAGRLSMMERGMEQPHPEEKERLAAALETTPDELFPS